MLSKPSKPGKAQAEETAGFPRYKTAVLCETWDNYLTAAELLDSSIQDIAPLCYNLRGETWWVALRIPDYQEDSGLPPRVPQAYVASQELLSPIITHRCGAIGKRGKGPVTAESAREAVKIHVHQPHATHAYYRFS
jgi:hypothetical protein